MAMIAAPRLAVRGGKAFPARPRVEDALGKYGRNLPDQARVVSSAIEPEAVKNPHFGYFGPFGVHLRPIARARSKGTVMPDQVLLGRGQEGSECFDQLERCEIHMGRPLTPTPL